MGGGAEGMFGVELVVTMMVPFLEGEGQALVVEELWIELVFRVGRDKDDLEKMRSLTIAGTEDAFGFAVGHRADSEKQKVIWETLLVMCEGRGKDVFDGLFVKIVG